MSHNQKSFLGTVGNPTNDIMGVSCVENQTPSRRHQHNFESSSFHSNNPVSKTYTPVQRRFRPKIKKEEVAATNQTKASVQKLSAWLSGDPFEQKKQRPVVRGRNVLTKARAFEPDQPSPVTADIQHKLKGSVTHRKKWIERGYNEGTEDAVAKKDETVAAKVSDRAKWLQEKAFQKGRKLSTNNNTVSNSNSTEFSSIEPDSSMDDQSTLSDNSKHRTDEDVTEIRNIVAPFEKSRPMPQYSKPMPQCSRPMPQRSKPMPQCSDPYRNEQTFDAAPTTEVNESPRNSVVSVSDRAKWLREEAFKKNKT